MTNVHIKRGEIRTWTCTKEDHIKTQGEDGHLQPKKRGLVKPTPLTP